MSPSRQRLPATFVLVCALFLSTAQAVFASSPANTWMMMSPITTTFDGPVFSVAVSPADGNVAIVGTDSGSIYRTTNGGAAWTPVAQGLGRAVVALAFDPFRANAVLAGTRGAGIWESADAGLSWTHTAASGSATVRAFGFAKTARVAGTNAGVMIDSGHGWSPAGLAGVDVDAIAVLAVNDPARIVAGGDSGPSDGLPLFESRDGGATWQPMRNPSAASSVVSSLAAGTLLPNQDHRPLLMGTNSGAFLSLDEGQTWSALALPPTDFTSAAFVVGHPDRFYVGSDGGGSDRGGLWASTDEGATFHDMKPPLPEVTAFSLSQDAQPLLVTATFRPIDQAVMLWTFRDAGGAAQAPPGGVPPAAHPAVQPSQQPAAPANALPGFNLTSAEMPYALAGSLSICVLLLALFSYLVRGRPRRA